MSLTYNGTEINQTSGNITYNGSTVKEVTMNGVSVWKKVTTKQVSYSITDLSATKRSLRRGDFSKINKVVLKGTITQRVYLQEQTISVNKTVENPSGGGSGNINISLADVWNAQSRFSTWILSDSATFLTNPLVTELFPGNLYASDGSQIAIKTISLRLTITYTPAE